MVRKDATLSAYTLCHCNANETGVDKKQRECCYKQVCWPINAWDFIWLTIYKLNKMQHIFLRKIKTIIKQRAKTMGV